MYDARQVANCLLDLGDQAGLSISHLALQKLVYFSHGEAYARFGYGLISNRVEAWKRGPVVRELYFAFKDFEDRPITNRASLLNFETRREEPIQYSFPQNILDHLREIIRVYAPLTAGELVAMTHESGTPWDRTIRAAAKSANVGMHIDEELIRSFFAPVSGQRT